MQRRPGVPGWEDGMKLYLALLGAMVLVAGCASKSENIQASYVSPITYENYTCQQLAAEGQRVSARAAQVAGVQDKNRKDDAIKTTVGVVLFWPVLFFNEGDGQTATELAGLKGQMKAIEQTSIQKNCGIRFQKA
jgi:hypothetical protein